MENSESGVWLEAMVVAITVGRVAFSLVRSCTGVLNWEAKALLILSTSALLLEFLNTGNKFQNLKPRLAASLGLMLGAVTVPLVLAAQSVQLLRASSGDHVAYLNERRQEFWFSVLSSLGMLAFLGSESIKLGKPRKGGSGTRWLFAGAITSCLCYGICTSIGGLNLAWAVQWGVLHAIGCKMMLEYLLLIFPKSVTIGEAMLLSEGLILFGGKAVAHTLWKIAPSTTFNLATIGLSSQIRASLDGIILGPLALPMVAHFLLLTLLSGSRLLKLPEERAIAFRRISQVVVFYSVLGLMVIIWIPLWLNHVHSVRLYALVWNVAIEEGTHRLALCAYWLGVVFLPMFRLLQLAKNGQIAHILLRKSFHVMAVIMFVPALLYERDFLELAFGGALGGFIIIEVIRAWEIPPFGVALHGFMDAFKDKRDSGVLIISHFSLLLGCALPVWLSPKYEDRPLAPFAGIISLGVGDTMASVVGYNFGSRKVSSNSQKTIEGTLSGILSMLVACMLLSLFFSTDNPVSYQGWFSVTTAVTAAGLAEAYISQLDNAFVPLLLYALLCL